MHAAHKRDAQVQTSRRNKMATAVEPYLGAYKLDPAHSTVQFAVRHQGILMFRATFADVEARLTTGTNGINLEGQVRVSSVSIGEPPEFRDHVVHSTDFFDADTHPRITFRSTHVELRDDGEAVVVGELVIRGVSREVSISGVHQGPRQVPREDPLGPIKAGLELRTTIDRRDWGMDWQLPMPDGTDAVGWEVEITALLEFAKAD
jgi:polyisoprenoid-binding protein YceI